MPRVSWEIADKSQFAAVRARRISDGRDLWRTQPIHFAARLFLFSVNHVETGTNWKKYFIRVI